MPQSRSSSLDCIGQNGSQFHRPASVDDDEKDDDDDYFTITVAAVVGYYMVVKITNSPLLTTPDLIGAVGTLTGGDAPLLAAILR